MNNNITNVCNDTEFDQTTLFYAVLGSFSLLNASITLFSLFAVVYLGLLKNQGQRIIVPLYIVDIIHNVPDFFNIVIIIHDIGKPQNCLPAVHICSYQQFISTFSIVGELLWQLFITIYFIMVILNLGTPKTRIFLEVFALIFVVTASVTIGTVRLFFDKSQSESKFCWFYTETELRYYLQHIWIFITGIFLILSNIYIVLYVWIKVPRNTRGKWQFTRMLLSYSLIYILIWGPYGISRLLEYLILRNSIPLNSQSFHVTFSYITKGLTSFSGICHSLYYGYTLKIWKQLREKWCHNDENIQLLQQCNSSKVIFN
jgi:hypothetical protein